MLCLIWCVSIQICLCKSDYISAFIWCLHITDAKQEQSPRERRDVQPLPLPAGLQQHVHHHVLPHRPKQVWFPSRLPLQELHAQLRIGKWPLKTKPTLFIHPNTTVKCFLKHKIQQDFDLLSQRVAERVFDGHYSLSSDPVGLSPPFKFVEQWDFKTWFTQSFVILPCRYFFLCLRFEICADRSWDSIEQHLLPEANLTFYNPQTSLQTV